MKYTKNAWFVNKFDIINAALIGPLLIFAIVLGAVVKGDASMIMVINCIWIAILAALGINIIMGLIITHKVWGWLLLPVAMTVRILVTFLAVVLGGLILAMFAYNAQSKGKINSAWTKDNRSSRYRDGVKDAGTAAGFGAAGGGLWGFLVRHTLAFCEKE